ncbi:hypothetical protein Dimus_027784 [Dionaea muscipula]
MSTSKESPSGGASKVSERKLPSWMISREDETKPQRKEPGDGRLDDNGREVETPESVRRQGKAPRHNAEETGYTRNSILTGPSPTQFSKLLEGVVFVLSGFVNPERGTLRSQALEMGAEYQPDWNSNCTLLVCAFPNTPKFRQVEGECGTIVSKEWITECYTQKKLVEIDTYLMYAGRPWRRSNTSHKLTEVPETSPPRKSQKPGGRPSLELNASAAAPKSSKHDAASLPTFSPLKVKTWAADDFKKTISWLESQDDKPEPSEIQNIAVEGILTCLQDAIDLLNNKEELNKLTDQWSFIPRAVEELINMEATGNSSGLWKQAVTWKDIYERELNSIRDDAKEMTNKHGKREVECVNPGGYDSDETIEMTEEEIQLAYENVASKLRKA